MKHRKPRDRQMTPEQLEEWRRWYEERHPEAAEADKVRRMEIVQDEWQD
jgi:hypothetical protein